METFVEAFFTDFSFLVSVVISKMSKILSEGGLRKELEKFKKELREIVREELEEVRQNVKEEVTEIRKEIGEMSKSISFLMKEYDDAKKERDNMKEKLNQSEIEIRVFRSYKQKLEIAEKVTCPNKIK